MSSFLTSATLRLLKLIRNELWSTPVWEAETGLTDKFNAELLREVNSIQSTPGTDFNVWSYQTPYVKQLREVIINSVADAIKDDLPKFLNQKLQLKRGWVNYHKNGVSLATHNHGNAILACTYYLKTPNNCGDLLLVDPRGGANWGWEVEGNIVGIKHKRIKPKEGNLVFFPGFLLHSVEENKSQLPRISLSSNIILV